MPNVNSTLIPRQRARLYRLIERHGVRGCKRGDVMSAAYSASALEALDSLIADGSVEVHTSYRGDGKAWGVVYVAKQKRGEEP
jgi:hypothetical protein